MIDSSPVSVIGYVFGLLWSSTLKFPIHPSITLHLGGRIEEKKLDSL